MPTPKKLPKARQRYYINDPVVVMPLAEMERLYQHLIQMGLYKNQPVNVKIGLDKRQTLLLKGIKGIIKGAKSHYNIKEPVVRSGQDVLDQESDALLSR